MLLVLKGVTLFILRERQALFMTLQGVQNTTSREHNDMCLKFKFSYNFLCQSTKLAIVCGPSLHLYGSDFRLKLNSVMYASILVSN